MMEISYLNRSNRWGQSFCEENSIVDYKKANFKVVMTPSRIVKRYGEEKRLGKSPGWCPMVLHHLWGKGIEVETEKQDTSKEGGR